MDLKNDMPVWVKEILDKGYMLCNSVYMKS
jgi:hypothetical protein